MERTLSVSASIAVISLSILIFRRLYFHPLSKYPGPLIAKVTDFYNVYHCLKGDRHVDFVKLHQEYGKFVRYGPNRLSINSATALPTIYGTHANTKKSYFYDTMKFYIEIPSTHATTDKAEHGRRRRILAQALSDRMLQVYEGEYIHLLNKFFDRFSASNDEDWSKEYDMGHEFELLNFDAMGEFCFGKTFDVLEDPIKAKVLTTFGDGMMGLNAVGHMPALASLKLDSLNPEALNAVKEYTTYSAELAQHCYRNYEDTKGKGDANNVFDVFLKKLKTQGGDDTFTLPELESESGLLVTAGADTSATAMANILFHLLNNPHTLARLTLEIRSRFSEYNQITRRTLLDCEYLAACINEGLRLTPIVGGCLQREVLPGGVQVDGAFIPEGIDVGVPHHAVMRNENYFKDPWHYDPSRWVPSETSVDSLRLGRSAFCPFGMGPTGCIGKSWAMTELKLALAQAVFRYDMQMVMNYAAGTDPVQRARERERACIDKFVVRGRGPIVRFRRCVIGK